MAMTKKDFEAIAEALRDEYPLDTSAGETYETVGAWGKGASDEWNTTVRAIADVCMASNGRFDRGRFLYACGIR